ncbi:MAG: PDZ domain-containing protein [Nitrospirota bacterium]
MKTRKIIAFIFLCLFLTSGCAMIESIKSDNIQKEIIEGNPQAFVKIPIWGVYVIENDDKEIEIYKVVKGSPANNADVRYGDIIVSVDGLPVKERYALFKLVYERKAPDEAIEVVLKRKDVRFRKSITPNSGYMMKDAYVFMREIVRTKEPLYLAIVVGSLNNIYLQGEALAGC